MACGDANRSASSPLGLPILNIALLGDFGVGKTSLIRRFKSDTYQEGISQDTIGDFEDVIYNVPLRDNYERKMLIRVHDTAGMEKDGVSLTSSYYRCVCVCVVNSGILLMLKRCVALQGGRG